MTLAHFRAFKPDDAEAYLYAVRENSTHLGRFVTTASRIVDYHTARETLAERLTSGAAARYGGFVGRDVIASVKLFDPRASSSIEIGIWCIAAATGRGVGKWMVSNGIRVAFSLGYGTVVLRHSRQNEASRRMIEAIGALLEPPSNEKRSLLGESSLYTLRARDFLDSPAASWSKPWYEF